MGCFDFFKSPEEKQKEELYAAIFQQAFPGGMSQLEKEVVELCEILKFKYPRDEVRRVYAVATNYYYLNLNKTDDQIALSTLLSERNIIERKHADKIANYLTQKLAKYAKAKSLLLLSSRLKCEPTEVKEVYKQKIKKENFGVPELTKLVNVSHEMKSKEALVLNMAEKYTPAALMGNWAKELLMDLEKNEIKDYQSIAIKTMMEIEGYVSVKKTVMEDDAGLFYVTFFNKKNEEEYVYFSKRASKKVDVGDLIERGFFNCFRATKEFNQEHKLRWKIVSEDEEQIPNPINSIIQKSPGLKEAIISGGQEGIVDFLKNNPDQFKPILEQLHQIEKPAEYYRLKAIDKIYDDKDYLDAITLIDKGLRINDKSTEPFLYSLKAECNILIGDYVQALIDINEALISLKINSPDNDRELEESINIRKKIKKKLIENHGEHIIDSISVEKISCEERVNKYVTVIKGKVQAKEILVQLIEVRHLLKFGFRSNDEEMNDEEKIEYIQWLDKQNAVFIREFEKIANEDEIKLEKQLFPRNSLQEILKKTGV